MPEQDPGKDSAQQLSYEEARDELVEVVRRLEQGGTASRSPSRCGSAARSWRRSARTWLDGARKKLDAAIAGAEGDGED